MIQAQPGRLVVHHEVMIIPPKPTEDDTLYRSTIYVNAKYSADGNSYAKGDPIPIAEADRQGLVTGDFTESDIVEAAILGSRTAKQVQPRVRIPDPNQNPWSARLGECPNCAGTGKRSARVASKHQPDCACPACKPCKACDGTGQVPV